MPQQLEEDLSEANNLIKLEKERSDRMIAQLNDWKAELKKLYWDEAQVWFRTHSKNHIRIIEEIESFYILLKSGLTGFPVFRSTDNPHLGNPVFPLDSSPFLCNFVPWQPDYFFQMDRSEDCKVPVGRSRN